MRIISEGLFKTMSDLSPIKLNKEMAAFFVSFERENE